MLLFLKKFSAFYAETSTQHVDLCSAAAAGWRDASWFLWLCVFLRHEGLLGRCVPCKWRFFWRCYFLFYVLIVSVTPLFKLQGIETLKLSFSSCEEVNSWLCGDHCDNVTFTMNKVEESSGEWCQKEIITSWDKANFTLDQHEWVNFELKYTYFIVAKMGLNTK